MIHYALDASFAFERGEDDPDLVTWLDAVVDHLYDLKTQGIAVFSDTPASTFQASLVVTAKEDEDIENVVADGMGTLRTAFQVCGASTHGWPTPRQALPGLRVRLVESSQRVLV